MKQGRPVILLAKASRLLNMTALRSSIGWSVPALEQIAMGIIYVAVNCIFGLLFEGSVRCLSHSVFLGAQMGQKELDKTGFDVPPPGECS